MIAYMILLYYESVIYDDKKYWSENKPAKFQLLTILLLQNI